MGSCPMRGMYKAILLPSMALSLLATPLVALLPGFSGSYILFYLAAATFLLAHWWTLASAIDSLFKDEKYLAAMKGLVTAFPACLTLALFFVAVKASKSFVLPAAAGVTVPVAAVSVLCVVNGIYGLSRPEGERFSA